MNPNYEDSSWAHSKQSAEIEFPNDKQIEIFTQALYDETEGYISDNDLYAAPSAKKSATIAQKWEGITFTVLRFPLLIFVSIVILLELSFYMILRQFVYACEYVYSWRGEKRKLHERLYKADSYEEWKAAAQALDLYLKKEDWKEQIPYHYYDYKLISKLTSNLKKLRDNGDEQRLRELLLQGAVKSNIGGCENVRLYSNTYYGTKTLVEDFLHEVAESLAYIGNCERLSLNERLRFFKAASRSYGRTALCLSGGASFGYYHLGVIKTLAEKDLLPKVITGTSAGSLIAAMVGCRTNGELMDIIRPEIYELLTACDGGYMKMASNFLRHGSCFDAGEWAQKVQWVTKGCMTFQEAFERTGRTLNISVVPMGTQAPPKLLNHITTPDCVIWTAVIASSAIPGILKPVVLLRKTRLGHIEPFIDSGHKWRDGSLRTDIPLDSLHHLFNVRYAIVSQVNPHVAFFFYNNKGSVGRPITHSSGKGWRGGFIASSLEHFIKLDLKKWLRVLRDLELIPNIMNQDWSFVWLQKFEGNVTILPKSTLKDYIYILRDPDYHRMVNYITLGQRNVWPALHMIDNRMCIERIIEQNKIFVITPIHASIGPNSGNTVCSLRTFPILMHSEPSTMP
ncbi:patatin-domain-containing protein [Basidiobolus meristosporus CBS 931.73]|uniref:Patatin-domain-containing protein n=1 Tax=Basidiobolus meristosporus CBS 931.73 TaxID=1314790 RepID=A0A1Y1YEW6_9FUNG|nr:patatin-domain-containing protein [Basidiobolus meristosporus CBS 931.73]|eukprot:ORX96473.1 patatin-domain-containing protein [Basidiobolus meristosporus CBS 931.73]